MENPPFWWYLPGKMGIFREGKLHTHLWWGMKLQWYVLIEEENAQDFGGICMKQPRMSGDEIFILQLVCQPVETAPLSLNHDWLYNSGWSEAWNTYFYKQPGVDILVDQTLKFDEFHGIVMICFMFLHMVFSCFFQFIHGNSDFWYSLHCPPFLPKRSAFRSSLVGSLRFSVKSSRVTAACGVNQGQDIGPVSNQQVKTLRWQFCLRERSKNQLLLFFLFFAGDIPKKLSWSLFMSFVARNAGKDLWGKLTTLHLS